MPTIKEIEEMGVDKFVDDVVGMSYENYQNELEEDGIKSEAELIEIIKRNSEIPLSDEWINSMFEINKNK